MAHSHWHSPTQPPFVDSDGMNVAYTQRYAERTLPDHHSQPVHHTLGPQLPPIHSIPGSRGEGSDSRRTVHLPPLQVSPTGPQPISRTPTRRSIPVAQLLSDAPASPPRKRLIVQDQRSYVSKLSSDSYPRSPLQRWEQPVPHPSYVPHMYGVARMHSNETPPVLSSRAPPMPVSRGEHYPSSLHHHPPSVSPATLEQGPHRFSPAISAYSSPTRTKSDSSPCSSTQAQYPPVNWPRPLPSALPPLSFDLTIRQQPVAARACGFGERDRRVIDPPPILELKITDRTTGVPCSDPTGTLVLNCSLLSADGQDDETELPATHPDMRTTQRLMGTLVASPYHAKDDHGVAGTFFVFPDLSCRQPGKFRLHFKLLRVEPLNIAAGGRSVARIVTDVFAVYTAKDFPGMRASSALLKALRRQGLNVGVKKGSEARKTKGRGGVKKGDSDDSDDDDLPAGATATDAAGATVRDADDDDDEDEDSEDDSESAVVDPTSRARMSVKRARQQQQQQQRRRRRRRSSRMEE